MFQQYIAHKENFAARSQDVERILYRLAQVNLIDDMCAHGFNRSHTDLACKFKTSQKAIHVISIYLIYLSLSLWSWLSFLL
jgi:hypothetical protein